MDLIKKRQEIKNRVYNPTDFDYSRESYHISIFKANLKKFLPFIDAKKYTSLYQEKSYFQYTSSVEQDSYDYLKRTKICNESNFNFNESTSLLNISLQLFI